MNERAARDAAAGSTDETPVLGRAVTVGDISLADFLLCAGCLGPVDDTRTDGIARLLGLVLAREPVAGWRVGSGQPVHRRSTSDPELDSDPASGVTGEPGTPEGDRQGRRRMKPIGTRSIATGRPWSEFAPLPRWRSDIHGSPLPHDPLWDPRWSRDIAAAAMSTATTGRAVDEPRAVAILSGARPLTEIPRLPTRTLARGGQILVDMTTAMDPFARDRDALIDVIRGVVGRDRTPVALFSGAPPVGHADDDEQWEPYLPPEPRTPVIALTDLGIGGPPEHAHEAAPDRWLALADHLRRRESRLIAVVPYPPDRWPAALRRAITILRWDRPTTLSDVLRQVIAAERG